VQTWTTVGFGDVPIYNVYLRFYTIVFIIFMSSLILYGLLLHDTMYQQGVFSEAMLSALPAYFDS
jgi:hypothetical protein